MRGKTSARRMSGGKRNRRRRQQGRQGQVKGPPQQGTHPRDARHPKIKALVGVYTVMVCRWTDHILARNPLLEVEADLS